MRGLGVSWLRGLAVWKRLTLFLKGAQHPATAKTSRPRDRSLRLHRTDEHGLHYRPSLDGGDASLDDHEAVGLHHRGRHARTLRNHRLRDELAVARDHADT